MSSDTTNQTTINSASVNIESDEDTLVRLNDLLASNSEATVGERDSEDFDELYVLPDPDPESGVHIVMGLSARRGLSHVATFDTDNCEATAVRTKLVKR
jgi:hypothetical protein